MEVKIYVVYCFFVASTNAFSIWPPFFDTAEMMSDVYHSLAPQNENSNLGTVDDNLLRNSLEADAEPASSVLSRLKSMLDSPVEDAKGYAAEKAKELVSNLEHNTNRIIQFTLGGANLLVDLGIKGGPTRLRNLKEGRSLLEYLGEMFAWLFSTIKSFFVAEQSYKKVNKSDEETANNKTADPSLKNNHDSITTSTRADKEKHANKVSKNESRIDDENSNNSSRNQGDAVHPQESKKNYALKASNDITFIPPKELSLEEKRDVENVRQEIITIKNTIQELKNKMKLHQISDDDNRRLKELKNQVEMKKKFIKITTSESIK